MGDAVLLPGSTGTLIPGLPPIDTKPLVSLLFETARVEGFTITESKLNGVRSFRAWQLSNQTKPSVTFVAHLVVPLFAFADAAAEHLALGRHIVDWHAESLDRAAELGWHRLSADVARLNVTAAVTAELADAELREIAYWNPETVGEVCFNCWD